MLMATHKWSSALADNLFSYLYGVNMVLYEDDFVDTLTFKKILAKACRKPKHIELLYKPKGQN